MSLKTSYEFTLPRGYVDNSGTLHRTGRMRLATARDELEPLRDPRVSGPDDPRLTVLVLARVIEQLGTLQQITMHEIEGLFAVDLAFLQDFYGVINFGTQEEFEALLAAQAGSSLVGDSAAAPSASPSVPTTSSPSATFAAEPTTEGTAEASETGEPAVPSRPNLRRAVEELPRQAL